MAQAVNPRTQRARDSITAATIELLENHPAGEISLSEVAKKANVSRATIYKYYSDVPTLIAGCAVDFIASAIETAESDLEADSDIEYLTELMRRFVKQIYPKRVFCEHAMYGPSSTQIVLDSVALLEERMRTRVVGKRLSPSGIMRDDYLGALSAGVVWLMSQWLRSNFKGQNSPTNFANRLAATLYQFSSISEQPS